MVGVLEFVIGFIIGLAVAIRGFSLRPDLAMKFHEVFKSFEDKKTIKKPTTGEGGAYA